MHEQIKFTGARIFSPHTSLLSLQI